MEAWMEEIKKSGEFNEVFYLTQNPDVKQAGMDPIQHYLAYGAEEGRNPSRHFDTAYYLENNPDVANSGFNPLIHYIRHGEKEGRLPCDPGKEKELKVSVIIGVYQGAAYLKPCLDSVLQQTLQSLEIIVVDDGSTDATPAILGDYQKRFKEIKVISGSHEGIVRAREQGIKHSLGAYCLVMDADDWLEPKTLQKLYDKAVEKDYDYISYACFDHDLKGTPHPCPISSMTYAGVGIMETLRGVGRIPLWSKLIKREFLQRIDWQQIPSLKYHADVIPAFWLECLKPKKAFLDECLYHYRRNPESVSYRLGRSSVDTIFLVAEVLEKTARAFHILEREQAGISAYVTEQLKRYRKLVKVSEVNGYFQKKWANSHHAMEIPDQAPPNPPQGYAVSVIIAAYNREAYLKKCLESVLSQTLRNVQVIVVNDGSTDNTQNIVESYLPGHPNLQLINQSNQGALKARCAGVKAASGDYILMVGSDDYLAPSALENCWKAAVAYDLDMVTFNDRRIDTVTGTSLSHYNQSSLCAKFVKQGLYQQIDYEDLPPIVISEDDLVSWLFKLLPQNSAHLNEDLYYRQVHPKSVSHTHMHRWVTDSIALYEYVTKACQKQGALEVHRQFYQWLLWTAHAREDRYPESAKELIAYLESATRL